MKKYIIFCIIILFSGFPVFSQEDNTGTVIDQGDTTESTQGIDSTYLYLLEVIENTDIGFIWGGELSQFNRLGYIGDQYQRFQIHFLSVIQNFDNPYEYFLYGKTNVQDNICQFQGSLQITEISIIEDEEYPQFLRVYLGGNYVLFEDQSCLYSGALRGDFDSYVYLDDRGTIFYDNLEEEEDDYANNQFYGDWENYFADETKSCNWGDHRIPFSAGLDMGPEEFKPSFQYLENGWSEYLKEEEKRRIGEEIERWWE